MKAILRKYVRPNYRGYILQTIYKLKSQPFGWNSMKTFNRIPDKISSFVKKELIQLLRRYEINNDHSRNQYFIQTVNNEYYELQY